REEPQHCQGRHSQGRCPDHAGLPPPMAVAKTMPASASGGRVSPGNGLYAWRAMPGQSRREAPRPGRIGAAGAEHAGMPVFRRAAGGAGRRPGFRQAGAGDGDLGQGFSEGRRGMARRFPQSLRVRVAVVFLSMTFLGMLVWLRLGWLQIVQGSHYRTLALEQRYRAENLVPERGGIYDRNDVPLVVTVQGNGVYAVPAAIDDPARAAAALAPILGQPAAELERRLRQEA